MTQAATTFQQWGQKGYFVSGFNGLGYDDATKQFGKGKMPALPPELTGGASGGGGRRRR